MSDSEKPKFKRELTFTTITQIPKVESTCKDACCTEKTAPLQNDSACNDSCCTTSSDTANSIPSQNPISPASKTYQIEGMDCSSCALTIENHLKKIPSVKSVNVNFSSGKAHIEHENEAEEITKEVSKIGFKATLLTGRTIKVDIPKDTSNQNLLIFSGVMLLAAYVGSYTTMPTFMVTILYALSVIVGGYKPAKSAFYAVKSGTLDMNVLMTVAVIGAAAIGEWLESATVVWLFALGNLLQSSSIEKTRSSIRDLMDLAPPEAWLHHGTNLIRKPVEEVHIGEVIVVKPGERIPLDGMITQGESSVNQAPITGESIPVDKQVGDIVFAGTINEHGSLEIKVTTLITDSAISKIIHLVEEAQEKKAPTQAFIDKFARIYTPIVFCLALLIMVIPPIVGFGSWGEWFYKGLELLVVACPCALVISTPVAIVSAIGNAAKNGILIKGGAYLEIAGTINTIAFDKTGTMTEGKPKVSHVFASKEVLAIVRTLEEYSNHPIAKSIVQYATENGIESLHGENFRNIVGKGIQATIGDIEYFAGNAKLFLELNVPLHNFEEQIESLQKDGNTIVIVGTKHELIGIIAIADTIRKSTVSTLESLKQIGIQQVIMLTGDNVGSAKKVASQTGVTRYFAELLPEDKVEVISQLQTEGFKVAMVGDGINDAPALATANIGIAMGGAGTDTAMETADIILMADNLEKLPHTIKLSRSALLIIKQNIWFSLIIKFLAITLIFPGFLTLWIAVLSDTGAALIVILNSMRLIKYKS
ncbi:cadmium-translocating P-type ATPase [Paenibacillus sp. LMG 31458]|uniref:Cd(2+)-exporting ATPase n=1 Tax=Paenibacillus phytorum TaxID=2654977 RepID=A0ABX1Y094_9BACL|nr:cation-translocating P-type ATPase [Paenibacillus phytorum]NOU73433.1 cadmium-translocating P-type ATPase [Paenibacillus phytorum]